MIGAIRRLVPRPAVTPYEELQLESSTFVVTVDPTSRLRRPLFVRTVAPRARVARAFRGINGGLPGAAARRRAPAIYSTLPCALALHRGAVGVARRPTNAGQNQARCPSRRRGASSHRSEGRRLPRKLGQVALRREGEGRCCAQAVNLARSAAQPPYNLLPCEFNASGFCGLMGLWHERWNNVVHRAFSGGLHGSDCCPDHEGPDPGIAGGRLATLSIASAQLVPAASTGVNHVAAGCATPGA